jgi:TatD DNase family protein
MLEYLDIHTHKSDSRADIVSLINLDSCIGASDDGLFSMGIHPWNILQEKPALTDIIEIAESLTAFGEMGLDFYHDGLKELQYKIFLDQINALSSFGKPFILHCVRAYSECLKVLKQFPRCKFIFHGYSSSVEMASQITRKNGWLSFGAGLFQSEKQRKVLNSVPLDKVFFETDDWNGSVSEIYKEASIVLNVNIEELRQKIWKNFKEVFGEYYEY